MSQLLVSEDFQVFLNKTVLKAKRNLNTHVDEILGEIRANHWQNMTKLDYVEASSENLKYIASKLSPYQTFNDWWENLTGDEQFDWLETCFENDYTSWEDEALEANLFAREVKSFLSSRGDPSYTPFCAHCENRHIEPGSCSLINSKYAESIIAGEVTKYNGLEVHGVRDVNANKDSSEGTCYEVDDDQPELYSVYVHLVSGGVDCVGDFSLLLNAEKYARELSSLYSWPISIFC